MHRRRGSVGRKVGREDETTRKYCSRNKLNRICNKIGMNSCYDKREICVGYLYKIRKVRNYL